MAIPGIRFIGVVDDALFDETTSGNAKLGVRKALVPTAEKSQGQMDK